MEPHRVAQPRTVEFVHRGAEVVQRGVQVDPRQCPVDLVVARGFVGLSRAGQARRTGGRGCGDIAHEVRDGVRVEQG